MMSRRTLTLTGLTLLWMLGIGWGFNRIWKYEATPGTASSGLSRLDVEGSRATLLMFAHPQCPCSRASIAELEQIMTQARGTIQARVYFLKPAGFPASWEQSDLWRAAEAIPGVEVLADDDGLKAREFGALTSGQVVMFDPAGRRIFSGGITGARGHQGDNAGRQALLTAVKDETAAARDYPVFGCDLFNPDTCCSKDSPPCRN
jgi:hypothetical protein